MASPNWVGRLVRNWNGRVGAVVPEAGDYAAAQVTYPAPYGNVQAAIEAAIGGGVTSWAGRTGAVVPEAGDYSANEVTYPAPYGDVQTAIAAALSAGAPATATPLALGEDGTVALSPVAIPLQGGTLTLPAGSSGRIKIEWSGNVNLGPFLVGTNGAQVYLTIGTPPAVVPDTTRIVQIRTILGLDLEIESHALATSAVVTGLAPGLYKITAWAQKTGNVSTASIVGERRLDAYSLP